MKRQRYGSFAAGMASGGGGGHFLPLVVESYGALGQAARDYVGTLNTKLVSQDERDHLPDQVVPIMQRLAVALQNGNARIQKEGLLRAHGARSGARAPRVLRRPNFQALAGLYAPSGGQAPARATCTDTRVAPARRNVTFRTHVTDPSRLGSGAM